MSYLYEQPYSTARGNAEAYNRWSDEALPPGSGRRAVHWRHLDSHVKLSHGHTDADMMDSPHRLMMQRRKENAAREASLAAEHVRMSEPPVTPRRKRYVEPHAQVASIQSYGIIVDNFSDRRSRRCVQGPADDLNADFTPRSHTPPATRRAVRTPGQSTNMDTYRVLDTREESFEKPRGMRNIIPADELQFNYVGARDAKVDRGLRCKYDVPQTLSFKP